MLLKIINVVTGIVKLVIGGLGFHTMTLLFMHGIYPQELTVLYLEMACAATGAICTLLGLEYLLYRPKEQRGIRNALIFDILISISLSIIVMSSAIHFHHVYLEDDIMGSDKELWDEEVRMTYQSAYNFSHAAAIVLIISVLFSLPLVYFNETQ